MNIPLSIIKPFGITGIPTISRTKYPMDTFNKNMSNDFYKNVKGRRDETMMFIMKMAAISMGAKDVYTTILFPSPYYKRLCLKLRYGTSRVIWFYEFPS